MFLPIRPSSDDALHYMFMPIRSSSDDALHYMFQPTRPSSLEHVMHWQIFKQDLILILIVLHGGR
jgi:hypothetical protein